MQIDLFPDQEESIEKLRASLRKHKAVLLQGETGSGKSIMSSYMIRSSRNKNLKSAFVVPRKELLAQMHETFDQYDIPHGFVAAGKPFNPYSPTHLCTVGSLVNRLDKINPKILFLDETHFGLAQLDRIVEWQLGRGGYLVGLTASPEKPGGIGLSRWYEDMIIGPSIAELIAMKRLSDYRLFAPSIPDLSGIKIVGGEYAKGQLSEKMEQDAVLIGDAVRHYKQYAMGKLNITFCTSIKHSQITAERFRDAGVPTMHMDGETPEEERRRIARALATGELLNVCSVDLMTFGYDLASASGVRNVTIESMSDLRPTRSRPLQRQKNGRVFRYKDYPALIFDHSGNYKVHGLPDDPVEWSLQGQDKKKRQEVERSIAIRQCSSCFYVHKPAPVCPGCGFEYPIQSRMIEEVEGELAEIQREEIKKDARMEVGMAKTLDDLRAIATARGYKYGWVRKMAQMKRIEA